MNKTENTMQNILHDSMLSWLSSLRPGILNFLSELKDSSIPGYYKYSLTGDLFSPQIHWGLGNAVFAAKTYYMLNAVEETEAKSIVGFIKTFQVKDGSVYDKKVERLSRVQRVVQAIRSRKINNLFNEQARFGETRQSFAAMWSLGYRPDIPFLHIPYTREGIEKYIRLLNWKSPWEASAVFNHILFFLHNNRKFFHVYEKETDGLIDHALKVLDSYKREDGAWYNDTDEIPDYQKVNGSMKIMIAYESVGRNDFLNPEGLIDICLSTVNDGHACNNFNIVCVLYYCSRKTDYRMDEIKEFCLSRLEIYKKHYWPEHGGFSFFERHANGNYLGAKITRGLKEPDIHGTVLFLWGIILIVKVLGYDDETKFNIPFT
jgi:hypothetical protein